MASPREAYREIARPSARFDAAANSLACFAIANYKCVVFSERRPRSARYFAELDEAPVGHIHFVSFEIVTHSGRHIETRAFVQIAFWTFVAKDILPIIGPERSCVFPLRISRSIPFANRDPSTLAGRNPGASVRFLEPRNDAGRFRTVPSGCLVVVWQGAVKRVLSRRELYRNVIAAMRRIWIVKSAVTSAPIFVP